METTRVSAMLPSRRRLLVLAGSLVLATTLAACGRKGPLEPPPGSWEPPPGVDKDKAKPPKGPIKPTDPILLDKLLN
jgi:predicted small lipoprotein YifL